MIRKLLLFGMLLGAGCARVAPAPVPGESSDDLRAAAQQSLQRPSVQAGIKKECDSFAGERRDIATARDKAINREEVEQKIDSIYQNDPHGRLEMYDLV